MSKTLNLAECPPFEVGDEEKSAEGILTWAGAAIKLNASAPITICKKGVPRSCGIKPAWHFSWQYGFMELFPVNSLKEGEALAKWARMQAALFIHLWCKQVGVELAEHLSYHYVRNLKNYYESRTERKSADK